MIKKKTTRSNPFITIILVLFVLAQFQYTSFGQEPRLDSLRNELHIIKPTVVSSLKDSSYINTLNALAFEISYINRDSVGILAEEALRHGKNIGYYRGEIEAYINLGHYHSDGGHHEKAAELMSKALEQSRNHKLHNLELRAIGNLAIQHDYLDKNELAFKEMLAGIDIAAQYNSQKHLSLFNMDIGILYLSLNEYHEGINYLKIAKKFGKQDGDELILASINSNLASAYNHIDKPEIGIQLIDEAITVLENNNDTDWVAFAYTIKGKSYFLKGDYTAAIHWFERSKKLYDTIVDDERSETILYLGMAKTYFKLEKDSISELHATKAYELAKTFKDKERQKNTAELLYLLHKKKGDLVASFKYLEIFQQLSATLAQDESKNSLLMFQTQMDYEKQKQDLLDTNKKSLSKRTNIIAAILSLVLILTGFIFIILRNHKIQKKLNKELKKSESELKEINETKNKLFSIIGHDLRGPIGAFSKLINLFNQGEIGKNQFTSFMPKLETDIKYISFALNNLLSWGRTQMKGTITNPVHVDLKDVVTDNINLLSEIAADKSITILNTLEKHTMVWADRDQVDVVLRNLISNALKFTPKNGSVTISSSENTQTWEVAIRDTGVGMNLQAQNKIFGYDSDRTTYGTANEKGTGLGLPLCKELVENNKGTIWVISALNLGTCFKFTLPKSSANASLQPLAETEQTVLEGIK